MIALIRDVRTEADVAALEADLEQSTQRAQALPDRFHERTGKLISFATVKRSLKGHLSHRSRSDGRFYPAQLAS